METNQSHMIRRKAILRKIFYVYTISGIIFCLSLKQSCAQTYAEKSGWKKGEKVVIFHVDDAGMSYDSNVGAIKALDYGIATSVSIMMPCPWVPDMLKYLKKHPEIDAGLHLTFNSEWEGYRWGPLTGSVGTSGLVDQESVFWNNVQDVIAHASAEEIEAELKAQLTRARKMGLSPTHLDTHMGALWAKPDFLEKYIQTGIREHIPVLFAAGHGTLLRNQLRSGPLSGLQQLAKNPENMENVLEAIKKKGEQLWNNGLAVADDLYLLSYDWEIPAGAIHSEENLRKFKTEGYKRLIKDLKPGITVVLIHCTQSSESFRNISDSGLTRKGDLLSMMDPELKQFIEKEGIRLSSWRELQQRRDALPH